MLETHSIPVDHIRDLVASANNGDEEAFNTLFERYKAYAWSVALRATSDRHLAEEAVVDGFAAAFRSLERIEQPERFQAYLGSCVRNEVFGQVKKRPPQRFAEFPDDFAPGDGAYGQPMVGTPESVAVATFDGEQAFAALQRLDDRQQQAIYLVDVEELSTTEAANALGLSANALYQLLLRARRSLRLQFIAPALDESAPSACRECNDGLAAYVHGAATSNRRTRIENHLAECPSCHIRMENAAETSELISRAGAVLPVGIGAAVAAKVGFTIASPSTSLKVNRFAAIKHVVVAHPFKTVAIVFGVAALAAGGITYVARSTPTTSASHSSISRHGAKSPRQSPTASTVPSTIPTTSAPPVESTTATTSGTVTTSPRLLVPAALAPPALSSTMTPSGTNGYSAATPLGSPFFATVSTATTAPSVSFAMVGALPAGLSFADHGGNVATFSGTPAAPGVFQSALTASTSSSSTTAVITITVTAPPAFTSSSTVSGTVGSSLTFPISATGFPYPAFSVSGPLPPGLRLSGGANSALTIVGTPTSSGSWTLSVGASNSVDSATQSLTVSIA